MNNKLKKTIIIMMTLSVFELLVGCSQSKPNVSTNSTTVKSQETKEEVKNAGKSYEFVDFATTWEKGSRGTTAADGILWVPQIKFTVKNTDKNDINKYFKVIFLDEKGTIIGNEIIENTQTIPSGYSKGPIFMRGTTGYTGESVFLTMDDSKKWHADLFEGTSYTGPWSKIKSVTIDLPEKYAKLNNFKNQSSTESTNSVSSGDFVFQNSSDVLLTESEVKAVPKEKLDIARNEIFARHGFIFTSQTYKDYFKSKSWYVPNSSFKGSDEELNKIEIANIQLIKKFEKE